MNTAAFQEGENAYATGRPFTFYPGCYARGADRAAWRLGWKRAAAKAGDSNGYDAAVLLCKQHYSMFGNSP